MIQDEINQKEELIEYLDSQIYDNPPEILFKIENRLTTPYAVITEEGSYNISEGQIIKNLLYIPGIGNIAEGTRVVYLEKDYVLCFGWHTNISNQTIYSWNLVSIDEDIRPKTLYLDMINKINLVHFR